MRTTLQRVDVIVERPAALDVHKAQVSACVRTPAADGGREPHLYLRALYERQRSRIGHAKAIGDVKHSMLVAVWHMLTNGQLYDDLGADYYRRRDPARTTKRLVAQLERLGHSVTLQEANAA